MSLFDHLLLGANVEGSGSRAHADGRKYAAILVFAIAAAECEGRKTAGPRGFILYRRRGLDKSTESLM